MKSTQKTQERITMTFLPKDYKAPTASGNYMKLQAGDNKIRILSYPVIGWEDWVNDKPVRYRNGEKPEQSFDATKPLKHFWSVIVWDYSACKICVLHITQATVRNDLIALSLDEDFGDPFFYDIKITKEGELMKTKYSTKALPPKPVSPEIIAAFHATPCNLEALFSNQDPFDKNYSEYTKGIFSRDDIVAPVAESSAKVTQEQVYELEDAIGKDEDLLNEVRSRMMKVFNSDNFHDIPANMFSRIMKVVSDWNAKKADLPF